MTNDCGRLTELKVWILQVSKFIPSAGWNLNLLEKIM